MDSTIDGGSQQKLTVADLEEMHASGNLAGRRFTAAQISNETYHAGPGISSTQIADFMQSPKRYEMLYVALDGKKKTSQSMDIGSAVHALVLEPGRFAERYAIFDGARTSRKAYEAFCIENAGCQILTSSEYQTVADCAEAVKADSFAMRFLTGGESEVSYYATDKVTGQLVRCRVDHEPEPASMKIVAPDDPYHPNPTGMEYERKVHFIVDMKTIRDFTDIEKQLWNYRRDVSAALYSDIYSAVNGHSAAFVHVYVATSEPHEVAVFHLTDDKINSDDMGLLTHGRLAYRHALKRIQWCKLNGVWPSSRGWDWAKNEPMIEKGDIPYWAYRLEG